MTYSIKTSKRFEKDLKLCQRRGLNMKLVLLFLETGTHVDIFGW